MSMPFHISSSSEPKVGSVLLDLSSSEHWNETMFTCDGSVLFRNEMKLFYWLEMMVVRKLTNRIRFAIIRNRHVRA